MLGASPKSDRVASALFGKAQQKVLGLLFGRADESFYLREIVRATQVGQGAVQRELQSLTEAGIIERVVRGRQVFYHANRQCPIFGELQGLIVKTAGVADVLRSSLIGLADRIVAAFIFGSFASGTANAASDVDLLVVGSVSLAEVAAVTKPAQDRLGREINPNVYPVAEFQRKLAARHHFVTSVMNGSRIFLLGSAHELADLAQKRVARAAPAKPTRNHRPARRRRS